MRYGLTRTVAPTDDVVTLAEAQAQLRVDTFGSPPVSAEDDLIEKMVTAVVQTVDAGTGWLGRALAPQTWKLTFKAFPMDLSFGPRAIRLPYPPFIEVVSFTYVDTDGITQTLVEGTDFRVLTTEDHGRVAPLYGERWPTDAREDYDSVQIVFRCGYVEGSPEAVAVPEQIKNYILSSLTDMYDSRGVDSNQSESRLTASIRDSLNNIRVWSYSP